MGITEGFNCLETEECETPICLSCEITVGAEPSKIYPAASISLNMNFVAGECEQAFEESFEAFDDEYVTNTVFMDDETGCLEFNDPVTHLYGSLTRQHQPAILTLLSQPVNLELIEITNPSATCCVFHYQCELLEDNPELPVITNPSFPGETENQQLGEILVPPVSVYEPNRVQLLGAVPDGLSSWGPVMSCGSTESCGPNEAYPAVENGHKDLYVMCRLLITLCRSDCDFSWYGSVDFTTNYRTHFPFGNDFAIDGIYQFHGSASFFETGGSGNFHIPNTGTIPNASGTFTQDAIGGGATPSFVLTMEGDPPCEWTGVTVIRSEFYTGQYGNFIPLRIVATDGSESVGDIEEVVDALPDGYDGYLLIVTLPITSGVTTLDDVLDLLDDDPRFAVSDRAGTGITYPFYSSPYQGFVGQGDTSGGANNTPVPTNEVFPKILENFTTPVSVDEPNSGDIQWSLPFATLFYGSGPNASGCLADNEGCLFEGTCMPTGFDWGNHDQYWATIDNTQCYEDITWTLA